MDIVISLIGHFCPPEFFNLPVKLNPVNAPAVYGDALMLLFLLELEFSVFCLYASFSYLLDFAEHAGWFVFVLISCVFASILVELLLMGKHNRAM